MTLSSATGALLRRWYLSLVLLGLTGYGAWYLWEQAEPVYTSSSVLSVVATPSYLAAQQSEDPLVVVQNPYGTGSPTLAGLLADSIANGNVVLPPEAEGASLDVTTSALRPESYFTVSATAPTRDAALAAVLALETQAPPLITDLQVRAGAPADQLFTAILARPATVPIEDYPDRMRVALGVALGGVLLTTLVCVLVDSAVLAARAARARRRGRARGAGEARAGATSGTTSAARREAAPDAVTTPVASDHGAAGATGGPTGTDGGSDGGPAGEAGAGHRSADAVSPR